MIFLGAVISQKVHSSNIQPGFENDELERLILCNDVFKASRSDQRYLQRPWINIQFKYRVQRHDYCASARVLNYWFLFCNIL